MQRGNKTEPSRLERIKQQTYNTDQTKSSEAGQKRNHQKQLANRHELENQLLKIDLN